MQIKCRLTFKESFPAAPGVDISIHVMSLVMVTVALLARSVMRLPASPRTTTARALITQTDDIAQK